MAGANYGSPHIRTSADTDRRLQDVHAGEKLPARFEPGQHTPVIPSIEGDFATGDPMGLMRTCCAAFIPPGRDRRLWPQVLCGGPIVG